MDERTAWALEWRTLQADYERYEFAALAVKLVAIASFLLGVAWVMEPVVLGALLALLWLQEAIHKTFQARLGARLQRVEAALAGAAPSTDRPFQLHADWLARRPGGAGLVAEYLASAMRPTVAFPHGILLIGVAFMTLMD